MRILFAVRGLNVGGAQRQLVTLARGLHRNGHDVSVATFYGGGAFEEELRSEGIVVHQLAKRGRWDVALPVARLARLARLRRPHVLHAYMSLANLAAAVVKPVIPGIKVVWGIRSSMRDLRAYDWVARTGTKVEAASSRWADAIIVNSQAARTQAIASGMPDARIVVVPNGIDCERFRPAPELRAEQRRRWGVPEDEPLVGMIARLDPVKDHATFLAAASRIASTREDVRFVCVGDGSGPYRRTLEQLASELGLARRVIWSGERAVTKETYSALDLAVLSSSPGESFPNVVGEAMACGVPCVVSDSGDAPLVVADTGTVVPPGRPEALAAGIAKLLERARVDPALRSRARARIEQQFSVPLLVSRTER
ncbi:MAG TPA: glycosyltransferase, partial [Anaeromyxobacteraceae bacterium]|nr:glycosyltransferase [Anaeromyxobacteraceae bacterium]